MESYTERIEPNSGVRASKGRISLEDYLDFLHSRKQIDLTVNHLNQIISIHGFKKLSNPKKTLVEAVNAIDLLDLSRSTRDDDVSTGVAVTLEEVISDLNELNWQECCVTSIQTLHSYKENNIPVQDPNIKKRKRKLNHKQVVPKFAEVGEIGNGCDVAAASSCGSVIGRKRGRKPKKTETR